jgi:hypothetical protein
MSFKFDVLFSLIGWAKSCDFASSPLLTDRGATIRSELKVLHFLRTVWGICLHFHKQSTPKQGIKKFLCHLPTCTTLVPSLHVPYKFDFFLSRDQTSRSRIWQIIREKFKCETFKAALNDVKIFIKLVMVRE